jgi:hypothetical protein
LASENEKGLKRPGRPYNGKQSYSGKCDVRLSAEENSQLDRLAERNGVTRSDIMRRALKDFLKFNGEE